MLRLLCLADEAAIALVLHADPWGSRGRMTREALRAWYARFGFVARTGRLVSYWPGRVGLELWRKPLGIHRRRHLPETSRATCGTRRPTCDAKRTARGVPSQPRTFAPR